MIKQLRVNYNVNQSLSTMFHLIRMVPGNETALALYVQPEGYLWTILTCLIPMVIGLAFAFKSAGSFYLIVLVHLVKLRNITAIIFST
jgi:hypothetical protein